MSFVSSEYRVEVPKTDCLKIKDLKIEFEINEKPVNESYAVAPDVAEFRAQHAGQAGEAQP